MNQSRLLERVAQFKRLDQKRIRESLSAAEERLWQELKAEVNQTLFNSTDTPAQEKNRATLRIPVDLKVVFTEKSKFQEAYIRNISGGGLYIETSMCLELGQELKVELDLTALNQQVLTVMGTVVWVNARPLTAQLKPGVGMKFTNLTPIDERKLQAIIHQEIDKKAKTAVDSKEKP